VRRTDHQERGSFAQFDQCLTGKALTQFCLSLNPIAQCVGYSSPNHIFCNVSRYLIGIRHLRVKASFETMHQEKITAHQFGNIDRSLKMRLSFEPIDSNDNRLLHARIVPLSATSDDPESVATIDARGTCGMPLTSPIVAKASGASRRPNRRSASDVLNPIQIVEVNFRYALAVDSNFQMSQLTEVLNLQPPLQPEDQIRANSHGHWWTRDSL
jgi:hypothetical protein